MEPSRSPRIATAFGRIVDIASEQHLNRNSRTFTLIPTLTLSIGLLVLISVGSVLTENWFVTRRIVQEFASRLITRVLSTEEMALAAGAS